MTIERWQRFLRLMDEAFTSYEEGLVALRKRVVNNMRRKVKDAGVLDHPREGSTPRSAPAKKRGSAPG